MLIASIMTIKKKDIKLKIKPIFIVIYIILGALHLLPYIPFAFYTLYKLFRQHGQHTLLFP